MSTTGPVGDGGNIVRARGLPWSCDQEMLKNFFTDCKEGIVDIHFTFSKEGRPSGEAYVEFSKPGYVLMALKKNKEYMGQRYVEVFEATKSEMDYVIRRNGKPETKVEDAVIRLRGLPFDVTKEEIVDFFNGLAIVPNGILMPQDGQGRASGEAYVKFRDEKTAKDAVAKHMERIGRRYIEVFPSSEDEVRRILRRMESGGNLGGYGMSGNRPGPYSRPSGGHRGGGGGGGPQSHQTPYGGGGGGGGGYNRPFPQNNYGGNNSWSNSYDNYWNDDSYNNSYRFPKQEPWGNNGAPNRGRGRMMGGGGRPGHFVHLRGLPYSSTEQDLFQFFAPIKLKNVHILFDNSGRPSGEAEVAFFCHEDAAEAMKRDRNMIGTRYIELYLDSTKQVDIQASLNSVPGNSMNSGDYAAENFAFPFVR